MVEKIKKHPLNARGKYYVNQDYCIWCATCVETAPDNFTLVANNTDFGAYVIKQPQTSKEKDLCEKAIMYCPHEAIHNDGE